MYLCKQMSVGVYIDCLLMRNCELRGRELVDVNYRDKQVEM